jgi:predicted TIM-barrel fold metal-dependent hydrolase
MINQYQIKIDAFSHVVPAKYVEALNKHGYGDSQLVTSTPPLSDMEHRFRIMDKYEGVVQVLTLAWPPLEQVADPKNAVGLAKLANDEMAELLIKYPDRFVAAIACLPMNNMDAALKEADRAINDLKFRGVQVNSDINGKPLDSPEFLPLFEKMAQYNLPIFIHPEKPIIKSGTETGDASKFEGWISSIFGRPYQTTVAMAHLVLSGILEKYPNLKIVTHHCGGMVPYFEERIIQHHQSFQKGRRPSRYDQGLTKNIIEYFKMFYNDTAIHGNTAALMCAYQFCGADHLLFGADMPLGDRQFGERSYRQTINAIEKMEITDAEKKMIYEENARKLMRLPV